MNAHRQLKADPLAIPAEHIVEIISRAVMLRSKPSRGGYEWLAFLSALDVVIGNDVLPETIADVEHDLGVDDADEPTCLACDQPACSCDARYDDRVAYGMQSASGLWL